MEKKRNLYTTKIKASLEHIKSIESILLSKDLINLMPENFDLILKNTLKITYSDNKTELSDLSKGIQQFYSNSFDLINGDLDNISEDNSKIQWLELNLFNDLWSGLLKYNLNLVYKIGNLSDYSDESVIFLTIIILIFFFGLGFFAVFLLILLNFIKKPKQELLMNFLKVKDYIITYYLTKCEVFILAMAASELDSNEEELLNDDDDGGSNGEGKILLMEDLHKKRKDGVDGDERNTGRSVGRKRKKFKYQKNNWQFLVGLFFFFATMFVFFYVNMMVDATILDKLNLNLREYNATCMTETFFYFTDNAQRLFKN